MQICSAKIIAETDKFLVTEKLFFIINEDKNAGYENCIVQWI